MYMLHERAEGNGAYPNYVPEKFASKIGKLSHRLLLQRWRGNERPNSARRSVVVGMSRDGTR